MSSETVEALEDHNRHLRKLLDSLQDELDDADEDRSGIPDGFTSDIAVEAAWKALDFVVGRQAVVNALRAAAVAASHVAQPGSSEDRPYKIRCSCGAWNYDHAAHVEREVVGE